MVLTELTTPTRYRSLPVAICAAVALLLAPSATLARSKPAIYQGKSVHIGKGSAHAVLRADADGKVISIGVVFTSGMLNGLPKAAAGTDPDFPYVLPMPTKGPKTVVKHIVINWESIGHPPAHVYDVPHFDFHFYVISNEERMKVSFKDANDSGDPNQQPPAELLPAGYVVPPGTAVPEMGVHAVNPAGNEFQGKPFTATFIYGYYDKRLTFIEPMASLAFLKSKPSFSADIARPTAYSIQGAYPSAYSVKYHKARKIYEVMLSGLK